MASKRAHASSGRLVTAFYGASVSFSYSIVQVFIEAMTGSLCRSGLIKFAAFFAGIIDILQEYNLRKAGENFLKGIFMDRSTISAVDPHKYAKRFLDFIDTHTM